MTDTAMPFTCRVRIDDAGIYGCNVKVLDPRSKRWTPLHRIVTTQESLNTEPYSERCAWDNRTDAEDAARRFIGKIAKSVVASS